MNPVPQLNQAHLHVLHSLQPIVEEHLHCLLPIDHAWQPTEYLPDFAADDWYDQLNALRGRSQAFTDEFLVCVVGNMITEEALPNYSVSLNHIARDESGISTSPWARWLRGWTAEENRHGDLLHAYLRLTGRVCMVSIEKTIHNLIVNGYSPGNGYNLYAGLVYTSFQERATSIAHNNIACIASDQGDTTLARICRRIAGDEMRHEKFYQAIMNEVLKVDTSDAMLAIQLIINNIVMPASLMTDGVDASLFDHFSLVAQRLGVYTIKDYAQIISRLIEVWDLEHLSVVGDAAKAQEALCDLPRQYDRLVDIVNRSLRHQERVSFSWIFGREA